MKKEEKYINILIEDRLEKIKWQLHAETSVTNLLLWAIVWKLTGWWLLCGILILGNLITSWNSVSHLGKGYLK